MEGWGVVPIKPITLCPFPPPPGSFLNASSVVVVVWLATQKSSPPLKCPACVGVSLPLRFSIPCPCTVGNPLPLFSKKGDLATAYTHTHMPPTMPILRPPPPRPMVSQQKAKKRWERGVSRYLFLRLSSVDLHFFCAGNQRLRKVRSMKRTFCICSSAGSGKKHWTNNPWLAKLEWGIEREWE